MFVLGYGFWMRNVWAESSRKKGSCLTASDFRKESDSLIREMLNPVNSLRSDRTGFLTHFTTRSRLFSENPAECQAAPLFPHDQDDSFKNRKNKQFSLG